MGTKYATQTGTSGGSSTTNFSPEVKAAYDKLLGQIGGVANTGQSNSTIQGAESGLAGLAANNNGNYTAAAGSLGTAATPTYENVGNYMNPFTSNVINATMANMAELNGQQQQGVIGNAIAKGAYGGNRVGVAQGELARQQGLANNQTLAGLWSDNYNQGLSAAQADKTANINAGNAYTGLGQAQSGTTQNALSALLSGGQFDLSSIYNNLGTLAGSASALSSSGATTTSSGNTSQTTPQGNIISQLLGAALAGSSMMKRDGGVVPGHYAWGGAVNDNYASGGVANDNYAPMREAAMASAIAGATPPAPSDAGTFDPLTQFRGAMQSGASNIRSFLHPSAVSTGAGMGGGALGHAAGGVVGYADGGRIGFAGGGHLSADDIAALYSGIIKPKGGVVGDPMMPPPAQRAAAPIDSGVTLNGDRLGLGMGNGPDVMAYADTPDNRGMNQPSGLHPAGVAGGVPFSSGDQFTTAPAPGYSQNLQDAWASLQGGNGLNLAPDTKQALLTAGLGMMSSKSPFALAGIGEGGLAGVEAWNERQKLERENSAQRAANAQTGSNIALQAQQAALTGAQTGRETQGIATDRWQFTPSMAGMVIQDKVSPSGSFVIPYNQLDGWASRNGVDPSQLPSAPGAAPAEGGATPVTTQEGIRFNVQPPANASPSGMGWTPTGQGILAGQTQSTLEQARLSDVAAQDSSLQLAAMKQAASKLPNTGLLAPGEWAQARGSIAKSLNTLASIAGIKLPFDPDQVGSIEEMNKLTTQFGFSLARTTGSDVASQVISQGIGAVPGIENTPQGFKAITGLIQAGLNRNRDYYEFLQKWVDKTGGDVTGASEFFNKSAPPSKYAQSAILATAVVPKTQSDIDNAAPGTLFNVGGQLMVK